MTTRAWMENNKGWEKRRRRVGEAEGEAEPEEECEKEEVNNEAHKGKGH